MIERFVQRRTVWWPTRLGILLLLISAFTPITLWWFYGESFLSVTHRVPADILVVEGWISNEGINASALEFQTGGYRFVVATGGLTGERWSQNRWNYALVAQEQLLRAGVAADRIVMAGSLETERQRTFEMARSAFSSLHERGIRPHGINVFTRAAHARRSRLVFSKVFGNTSTVGVISWAPENTTIEPWWRSSERAEEMIKESVGFVFELLVDSGRTARALKHIGFR
ncbi:MAG: ElyC/SanA/YdcF family protein [Opitutus sp.]